MVAFMDCGKESAYLAIVITILPLWILLTTLIVFLILAFHKNLRANKIYDNCSKNSAHYAYYVEIRTGEPSSTYNRRRTALFLDLFDDSQTTLARVAIPGHIIFGRRDSPNAVIEDDKYPELRISRFWLYRSSRLRRVTTIRLTHSCSEPEAKIMIYGVEIRVSEADRHRLFFPIMNYISAYGPTNKPGSCFDLEPAATISAIGGGQSETSTISEQLSYVDQTILAYLMMGIIFILSTVELLQKGFEEFENSAYHGILVGFLSFILVTAVAVLMRYIFKRHYSLSLSLGPWATAYYSFNILILFVASACWIYSTVNAHNNICPKYYSRWILCVSVAVLECGIFASIFLLISWIISVVVPKGGEHYMLPDDREDSKGRSKSEPKFNRLQTQVMQTSPQSITQAPYQRAYQQPTWPPPTHMPYMLPPNVYGQPMMMGSVVQPIGAQRPLTQMTPHQLPTPQSGPYPSPPVAGYGFPPAQVANLPVDTSHASPIQQQQQPTQKITKKVGSNESTGSSYYQQLMKNKGGVKSISQYGELLRQKKTTKK